MTEKMVRRMFAIAALIFAVIAFAFGIHPLIIAVILLAMLLLL